MSVVIGEKSVKYGKSVENFFRKRLQKVRKRKIFPSFLRHVIGQVNYFRFNFSTHLKTALMKNGVNSLIQFKIEVTLVIVYFETRSKLLSFKGIFLIDMFEK